MDNPIWVVLGCWLAPIVAAGLVGYTIGRGRIKVRVIRDSEPFKD